MRIFITGAANGIGQATTNILLDRGHEVIAYDRDADALEDLADDVTTYHGDVYDRERVTEVIDQEAFDVLVNNAGYQALASIEDIRPEQLEEHFRSNLFGAYNTIQTALPMLRERGGTIINVSSLAGIITAEFWGSYSASKAALEQMSDALRMELRDQPVDVVIIEPSAVETGFNRRGLHNLKEYLPDSFYSERYSEKIQDGPPEGITTEACARKIARIIEKDRPRPRYQITWQAKAGAALKRVLPTSLLDRLARNF